MQPDGGICDYFQNVLEGSTCQKRGANSENNKPAVLGRRFQRTAGFESLFELGDGDALFPFAVDARTEGENARMGAQVFLYGGAQHAGSLAVNDGDFLNAV